MTNTQFIAKVYEILSPGLIEIDGKQYYKHESVIDALEWIRNNRGQAIEVDTAKILADFSARMTKSITG